MLTILIQSTGWELIIQAISLLASMASLVLAIVAIWLSFKFYGMSVHSSEKIEEANRAIGASVDRLEKVFQMQYSDTFSMVRDTYTDFRNRLLPADTSTEIEQIVRRILTSEPFVNNLSSLKGDQLQLKEVLESTASNISSEIRDATSISISLTNFIPNASDLILPVEAFGNFGDLTYQVYYALKDVVVPHHYGTSWVLSDKESGKIFKNSRMIIGEPPGKPAIDLRTLEEVGIKAGMSLEVIAPEKQINAA